MYKGPNFAVKSTNVNPEKASTDTDFGLDSNPGYIFNSWNNFTIKLGQGYQPPKTYSY